MTDWIEHNGGPQPVGDDVWICIDAMPDEMEEVGAGYVRLSKRVASWKNVTGFFILNQHLIDAAMRRGIELGLEAAARDAEMYVEARRYEGDDVAMMAFACHADDIRALDPDTIAREAVLEQLTTEAQAQGMGYDPNDAKENTR
jgi:hypothetical protein